MLPWLMALQALVTLALTLACWHESKAKSEALASVWQALAELRMHHNELEHATDLELTAIHDRFDDLDSDVITVAPPPEVPVPELPQAAPAGGQLNGG